MFRPSAAFLAQVTPGGRVADATADAGSDPAEPITAAVGDRVEIRYETFSPAEEYLARDGRTEDLHEEFHAVLALDYKGVGTVTAQGIRIKDARLVGHADRKLGRVYGHPDSDLCNRPIEGPLEVRYTFNPARPEVVHVWSMAWAYLETLPARDRVPILDKAALAAAAAGTRRQIRRFAAKLEDLHEGDSRKAVDDLSHNLAAMDRAVVALEPPVRPAPRRQASRQRGAADDLDVPFSGFDRAGTDTESLLAAGRQTAGLIEAAARDFQEVARHRQRAQPVLVAHDPLDDL